MTDQPGADPLGHCVRRWRLALAESSGNPKGMAFWSASDINALADALADIDRRLLRLESAIKIMLDWQEMHDGFHASSTHKSLDSDKEHL